MSDHVPAERLRARRHWLGAMGVFTMLGGRWGDACSQPAGRYEIDALATDERPGYRAGMAWKAAYVDFWASWCPPCRLSFPYMNRLQQQWGERGLRVVAVNLDRRREDAERFLRQYPPQFPLLWDAAGQWAERFGVQAMPSAYLLDGAGNLLHEQRGFRASDAPDMDARVAQLMRAGG